MGRESLETDDLRQRAVYWEGNGRADDSTWKVKSPVEICCRWLTNIRDPKQATNETLVYDARVYVDRQIPEGSILWEGDLKSLPLLPTPLFQFVGRDKTPDLKGTKVRRCVYLIRYGDTVPTIDNT